jgi:hypothetical protein
MEKPRQFPKSLRGNIRYWLPAYRARELLSIFQQIDALKAKSYPRTESRLWDFACECVEMSEEP